MNLCVTCSADSRYCGHPDYDEGAACLTAMYDVVARLVASAARGKQYSKSDRFDIKGLVTTSRYLAKAACVDLTDAYQAVGGGKPGTFEPERRWANRALLHLNHLLLECARALMVSHAAEEPSTRLLQEAFDRFRVRELYATAMEFAAATGVQVEG